MGYTEIIAARIVNRRVAALAVLTAALLIALNLYAPANPTPWQRLLASLLIALCSLPTLLWASRREWRPSLMPFCGGVYALSFGSPIFLRREFTGTWFLWFLDPKLDDALIDAALLLALAGWVFLMAGYFGLLRERTARKLPRINVLAVDSPRQAAALAVVIGVVAAPFLYLHAAAQATHFTGKILLPPGVGPLAILLGQFVLLSILILFFLQLRGELGLAGKAFMWTLVAYYTLVGLSTGLVSHGLSAVLVLFMAHAVTAPAPTWKLGVYGVLTAAILSFVLLPARLDYRQLIWTHGHSGPALFDDVYEPISSHDSDQVSRSRTLASFTSGSFVGIDADGEWQLYTRDPVTWRIDTSTTTKSRLIVGGKDMELELGDTIRIEADADNWAEYRVKNLAPADSRITFRLAELMDSAGDRSSLKEGASAVLRYTASASSVTISSVPTPATLATETMDSPGRNPLAPNAHESHAGKLTVYMQTLWGFVPSAESFEKSVGRLDVLQKLAWLTGYVGREGAYLYGETYYPILFKCVPHLIWPDKPDDVRDLGHRYGFLPEGNEVNAVNVHHVGEMYINFGAWGVVLGMFVLGVLYRIIYELFFHANASLVTMAAGAHVLTVLLVKMEDLAAQPVGFVLCYVILLFVLDAIWRIGRWTRLAGIPVKRRK